MLLTLRQWLTVAIVAMAVAIVACGQGDDAPVLPPATEDGGTVIEDTYIGTGNPGSDVVVALAQGGPMPFLVPEWELQEVLSPLDLEQVYLVNVHQAQTINAGAFIDQDITFAEAKAAGSESAAMLAAVVAHFKDQGKTVYVVGISFGAFMVQELLATQGNVADGYLIAVGRIDMPAEVWTEFSEGRAAGFVNGTEIVEFTIEEAGMGAGTPAGDRNMARLAAGLGHNRYSERLARIDMANVVYVFGTVDEQVGRLSDAEREFLSGRDANVIAYEGGHDTPAAVVRDALSRTLPPELLN